LRVQFYGSVQIPDRLLVFAKFEAGNTAITESQPITRLQLQSPIEVLDRLLGLPDWR